jgi:hypothetical protein
VWFITSYSVNVPVWDQFQLVSFFEKIASKNINLVDFFIQHNEHRIFFPKILFALLAFSSRWNIKLELYFSFVFAVVNFWLMYKIASASKSTNKSLFHLFNILTCLLIFSLVQYENWLWGFQIPWFFVNTCVILTVFILSVPKTWPPYLRLSLSAICCFTASFSLAHGLFSWLAVIPSVASIESTTTQKRIRLLLWIMLFALSSAIYSIGYQKPSHHPDTLFFLKQPLTTGLYFLSILGSPLSRLVWSAAVTGFVILLTFLSFNIYWIKNYKSRFAYDAAPWLSLGWFATLFALVTTLGRAGFGIEQSTSSRYTTVLILLVIACLQMWRLLIGYNQKWLKNNSYILPANYFVAGILTALFISVSTNAITQGQQIWLAKNSAKNCLEWVYFFDDSVTDLPDSCLPLYPKPAELKDFTKSLQNLGFRDFKNIAFVTQPINNYGHMNVPSANDQSITLSRSGGVNLSGLVTVPTHNQIPQTVLFSWGRNQSFFANTIVHSDSSTEENTFNSSKYKKATWEANILLKSLPPGETKIKSWIHDPEKNQFIKLNGEFKVNIISDNSPIKSIQFLSKSNPEYVGYLDAVQSNDGDKSIQRGDTVSASGWAILTLKTKQKHWIVLTYGLSNTPVAITGTGQSRPDVAEALENSNSVNSGWRVEFSSEVMPRGIHEVQAWIYEPTKNTAIPFGNAYQVEIR